MTRRQTIAAILFGRRDAKRRRPWPVRWLRRTILLAVFLIAAYVTLPWWIPTDWLSGKIINQLQADLGRRVYLRSVEVSWSDGVVLHDLSIERRPGFGDGPLLQVERVSLPFTPIRTLLTGRVSRMDVLNARVWVVRNEAGEMNITGLKLPSMTVEAERVSCDKVRVVLNNMKSQLTTEVDLVTLQFRVDPRSGQVEAQVSGQVAYTPHGGQSTKLGTFGTSAEVLDPYVASSGGELHQGGKIRLSWQTVDLESLTVTDWEMAQAIGLQELRGTCDGRLTLLINSDGTFGWQVDSKVSGLQARLDRSPWELNVPGGQVALAGSFDSATLNLSLDQVKIDLPGLYIDAGVDYRRTDANYLGLNIRQALLRPGQLAETMPRVMELLPAEWRLAGEVELSGSIKSSNLDKSVNLTLDATRLDVRVPRWVDKPRGLPARVRIDAGYRHDLDRLDLGNLSLELGSAAVRIAAHADQLYPVFTEQLRLEDVWLDWMAAAIVDAPQASELLHRLPFLQRAMGRAELSGPTHAEFRFEPIGTPGDFGLAEVHARQLTAYVDLGPGSRLSVAPRTGDGPPVVSKATDAPLRLALECRFPSLEPGTASGLPFDNGLLVLRLGNEQDDDAAVLGLNPFAGKLAFSDPDGSGPAQPRFDLVLDGRAVGRQLGRLKDLSPLLTEHMRASRFQLDGGFAGDLNVRLGLEQIRARLALQLEDLLVSLDDVALPPTFQNATWLGMEKLSFHKPRGTAAALEIDYAEYPLGRDEGEIVEGHIRLTTPAGELYGERDIQGGRESYLLRLRVDDVAALAGHIPELTPRIDELNLSGGLETAVRWQPGTEHQFDFSLDATRMAIGDRKAAGVPMLLNTRLVTDLPDQPAQPRLAIRRGELVVGRSDLVVHGSLRLLPVGWDQYLPPPIEDVEVMLTGHLAPDDQFRSLLPELAGWLDRVGASGRLDLYARLRGGWKEFQLTGDLDATTLGVQVPGWLSKAEGVNARGVIDLTFSGDMSLWKVAHFTGELDNVSITASGHLRREGGRTPPSNYDITLGVKAPDLAKLTRLCPALLREPELLGGPLTGGLEMTLHLFDDGRVWPPDTTTLLGPVRLLPSRLHAENVSGKLAGAPFAATGDVQFSDREIFVPRLAMVLGDSRLSISTRITEPAGKPTGWAEVAGQRLDVDELLELWGRLRTMPARQQAEEHLVRLGVTDPQKTHVAKQATAMAASGAKRAFESVSQPVGPVLTGQEPGVPTPAAVPEGQTARQIIDFVQRCDLRGNVHLADVFVTDVKNQTRYKLSEFRSAFTLDRGEVRFPFQTAMEGGTLTGTVKCDLASEDKILAVDYDASKLFPTKRVQPIIEAFFPGMVVNGFVTMREVNHQKLLPDPGDPNWPTGSGEIIFESGMLKGQAGPDWMVKVFPGLKLTEYRFVRMHDWFTLSADGETQHHMIFEGESYDIYMIGTTHRGTGEASYTVGVDLLASLDSKTWSVELHQGKIPLMYVSGRIENRELKDARYNMVAPTTALWQMLFRNNILYRGVIERALKKKPAEEEE